MFPSPAYAGKKRQVFIIQSQQDITTIKSRSQHYLTWPGQRLQSLLQVRFVQSRTVTADEKQLAMATQARTGGMTETFTQIPALLNMDRERRQQRQISVLIQPHFNPTQLLF